MQVEVTVRGEVPPELADIARTKVAALEHTVKGSLMRARVVLMQEANPRIARGARAEGEVVLAGHPIRASVAAPVMVAAIDELAERLQDELRAYVERHIDVRRSRARADSAAERSR
jgi:ribosome-associated translation inhibitor RaiA